jgi:hypothetical protein
VELDLRHALKCQPGSVGAIAICRCQHRPEPGWKLRTKFIPCRYTTRWDGLLAVEERHKGKLRAAGCCVGKPFLRGGSD